MPVRPVTDEEKRRRKQQEQAKEPAPGYVGPGSGVRPELCPCGRQAQCVSVDCPENT